MGRNNIFISFLFYLDYHVIHINYNTSLAQGEVTRLSQNIY